MKFTGLDWGRIFIVAAIFGGGCTGNYGVLGPLTGFTCGGISFTSKPCPTNALWATTGRINISGPSVTVDSFNSSAGPYGPGNMLSTGNIQAAGGISISGSGASISGSNNPNTAASLSNIQANGPSLGDLNFSGTATGMTLSAGDYYYRNINISGTGAYICTPSGQVRIWFDHLNVSGNSDALGSPGTLPNNLWLLGTCGADANISGNGVKVPGVLYTPSGNINVSGNNDVFEGPLVGANINVSGISVGIHRDTAICGI
jgi:hypothetical protein